MLSLAFVAEQNGEIRRTSRNRNLEVRYFSPTSLLASGEVCPAYLLPTFL